MQNFLFNQTSPYLLQHANNPVHWYPWCEEAFQRAKKEDKPIFLSIGYSTCHWCHVMAHESFEDTEIAEILNKYFISIKVDKEERPDIDNIYMSVCQAITGSGGWPTTIFLTPDQKPFYVGTYFPKVSKFGQIGLIDLLLAVKEQWKKNKKALIQSADKIIEELDENKTTSGEINENLIESAFNLYKRVFDKRNGGFGDAPKFPTPHNLIFLMKYYEKSKDKEALNMVEKTLIQMYKGGIFDHIGGGFSRYSTDRYFLVPHFEKMLYDNALLIMAYSKAYEITKKDIYRDVAIKTVDYVLREMTSKEGGFYSAQDADSEGIEGKYYLFKPSEIIEIIGEETGDKFNKYFNITERGNFEGENIPVLLENEKFSNDFNEYLSDIYEYRKNRYVLHLDDKVLTNWNGLMISAMCQIYRITADIKYLNAAEKAQRFIESRLCENDILYISYRNGKHSEKGFLDDYANEIFALLSLYEATLDKAYIEKAIKFCNKAVKHFYDEKNGGFFLYGDENEQLILRPKETYDGAVFSGNSAMAYNLVRLGFITGEKKYKELAEKQLSFMSEEARNYPIGYAMFLVALLDFNNAPDKITIVLKESKDIDNLSLKIPLDTVVCVLNEPTNEYPVKNDKTTFYACKGHSCKPPVNEL